MLDDGWTIEATAERFQVDAKTVRKWRDRFLAEGDAGLLDRSSVGRIAHRTGRRGRCVAEVLRLRRKRRWGADHIASRGRPGRVDGADASCDAEGCGRLDRGDRATDTEPVRRYQRERPGELIHVDVKKLAGDPRRRRLAHPRPRQRATTGGHARSATATSTPRSMTAPGSSTPRSTTTNKPPPPPRSGPSRTPGSPTHGITVERVITDNGACYRSGLWHRACASTDTDGDHERTRPYRPQTNGKVERFHRILLEEWAYIRPWTSEPNAHAAYDALHPLLQSPPIPRRARLGNTHRHPHRLTGTTSPPSTASGRARGLRGRRPSRRRRPRSPGPGRSSRRPCRPRSPPPPCW